MLDNLNTKTIYSSIQKQLFYMIPEKWNSIYLYASVQEKISNIEMGELFFYYFPKGILKKNPINSYEIPSKFNLDEENYIKLMEKLYELIKDLRREFKRNNEEIWNSITIKIEKFHFIIEFNYDKTERNEEEKHIIWCYQNLRFPIESYSKKEKQIILQFLQEEAINPIKMKTYNEMIYHNPIKNELYYNREKREIV